MLQFALAAFLFAAAPPADLYSAPQSRVTLPDGRRINLACSGEGGPVVILNGGAGLPSGVWARVQPLIAASHRVCVFDRPGYGFSDPGPMPRTAISSADDLYQALQAAGLKPPYVLVGHSRGGFDVRQFAARHPLQTAGLVLVDVNTNGALPDDPKARDSDERACVSAVAAGRMKAGEPEFVRCGSPPPGSPLANPDMARAVLSELDNISADGEAARRIGTYGDLPMIVLTAGQGAEPAENDGHAALAAQSSRGQRRVVAGSGHVIQMEKPQDVAAAVADVTAMSGAAK